MCPSISCVLLGFILVSFCYPYIHFLFIIVSSSWFILLMHWTDPHQLRGFPVQYTIIVITIFLWAFSQLQNIFQPNFYPTSSSITSPICHLYMPTEVYVYHLYPSNLILPQIHEWYYTTIELFILFTGHCIVFYMYYGTLIILMSYIVCILLYGVCMCIHLLCVCIILKHSLLLSTQVYLYYV